MLTKEELVSQDTKPLLKEVSLELYKEFCEDILFKKRFHYYFTDGTDLIVECKEQGVFHMLAIHHIDYRITRNHFFAEIENGLSLSDFASTPSMNKRYKKYKERIAMFSCIYRVLRYGRVFYVPNKNVPNTGNVKSDYILFRQIDSKGMNIGLKYENGYFMPFTNLISKSSCLDEYISSTTPKIVYKLIVSSIDTGETEEEIIYTDNFIFHK